MKLDVSKEWCEQAADREASSTGPADIKGGRGWMNYVVGFMFDTALTRVALIRKAKPAWQAGKLNGIGGKVEDRETFLGAMVREFREETGYLTQMEQWRHYHLMHGENEAGGQFCVYFFATTGALNELRTTTEEAIEIHEMVDLNLARRDTVENLVWLVGIARDHLQDGRPKASGSRY